MSIVGLTWFYFLCLLAQANQELPRSQDSSTIHSPGNLHGGGSSELEIDEAFLEETEAKDLQSRTKGVLSEWVLAQLNSSKAQREMMSAQSFLVSLQSYESYQFRWDLVRENSQKRDYLMLLNVFTYQRGDDITLSKEPEQDCFVSVEVRSNVHEEWVEVGKVYISRNLEVHFPIDGRLVRVQNFNRRTVLLQVGMEKELKQLSVIKEGLVNNEHFQLPAQKLNTIFQESKVTDKARNRMYKWEWGFLEREERYEDQMLKLTAAELIAILATAVVQIYCIKSLLDHKQII